MATLDIRKQNVRITGTKFNYYFICHRKLWLFSHYIQLEKSSELVSMGSLIHEKSFKRERLKEIELDGLIKIDFIDDKSIHEVKLSSKMKDAHVWQVKYYLYYLEKIAGIQREGVIHYPRLKKKEEVVLEESDYGEIENIIQNIIDIETMESPPKTEWMSLCRKCSYAELCWA